MSREENEQNTEGTTRRVPSYMRETISSLKKNRERVSNSCTPRRLASAGNTTACFDDYRTERCSSVGPSSARSSSSSHRTAAPQKSSSAQLPGYMRPTMSSSKKSLSDKYLIRPPRVPSTSSNSSKTPSPKSEVKKAERRIQGSNVPMASFVESLRRENGGSEKSEHSSTTTITNVIEDIHRSPDARQDARNRARERRATSTGGTDYINRNKEAQQQQRQMGHDKKPGFMQPTILSSIRNYTTTS